MEKLLELENVSYSYQDGEEKNQILDHASYLFEKGKIYAVVGASGSGKTTTLSLVSGLDKPDDGKVLFKGKDIQEIGLNKYRREDISIVFQKKFGAGFFGGEGFIMQRLSGNGIAFLEFDGHVVEYELRPGQQIVVDTGYLAAMDATCSMEIQTVPGLKNMVFGGEGVFNTVVTGPGHVWLQTMPISSVAGELLRYMPAGK